MAHFDPIIWQIDLSDYHSSNLNNNIKLQAKFVHEYIHYCQMLHSTIGRVLLLEIIKCLIRLGLCIHYNGNIPNNFSQINLESEFNKLNDICNDL